jgi:hypothetical protein
MLSLSISPSGIFSFDLGTSSLALCCRPRVNGTSSINSNPRGLTMNQDRDYNALGSVVYTPSVGTARMTFAGGELSWMNDRFGGWLVCDTWQGASLWWWDVVSNMGYDAQRCARVRLVPVTVADGEVCAGY